jgi:hypothetical protein
VPSAERYLRAVPVGGRIVCRPLGTCTEFLPVGERLAAGGKFGLCRAYQILR